MCLGNKTCRLVVIAMILLSNSVTAFAQSQSAIQPVSEQAQGIAWLWWIMFWVASLVFLAVLGMLGWGLWRGRRQGTQLQYVASRNLVIIAGVVVPLITVISLVGGSLFLGRSLSQEAPDNAINVRITGWMWWWEIEYLDEDRNVIATTANELHVPVGRPVKVYLESGDVIHSFWVPQLHGKTDMIPGRTNTSWFEASVAGTYRGQCAEFCGSQHALMGFLVQAVPPPEFKAWLTNQQMPATTPNNAQTRHGKQVFFEAGCNDCHTIRGTAASGDKGPDLTHLASRQSLAAVTRANNRSHLGGWVSDPHGIKPGAKMPAVKLDSKQFRDLLDYLQSLH